MSTEAHELNFSLSLLFFGKFVQLHTDLSFTNVEEIRTRFWSASEQKADSYARVSSATQNTNEVKTTRMIGYYQEKRGCVKSSK